MTRRPAGTPSNPERPRAPACQARRPRGGRALHLCILVTLCRLLPGWANMGLIFPIINPVKGLFRVKGVIGNNGLSLYGVCRCRRAKKLCTPKGNSSLLEGSVEWQQLVDGS